VIKASVVRERILSEHKELRTRIQVLQRELKTHKDSSASGSSWRKSCEEFLNLLEQHMTLEDRVLEPVLRHVDAWGEIRSQRFLKDHKSQRKTIADVRVWLNEKAIPENQRLQRFSRFLEAVLQDITDEERDVLKPELFRDDTIRIDAFGG
jgi:hemerythrin-like domain-containing protein